MKSFLPLHSFFRVWKLYLKPLRILKNTRTWYLKFLRIGCFISETLLRFSQIRKLCVDLLRPLIFLIPFWTRMRTMPSVPDHGSPLFLRLQPIQIPIIGSRGFWYSYRMQSLWISLHLMISFRLSAIQYAVWKSASFKKEIPFLQGIFFLYLNHSTEYSIPQECTFHESIYQF